jgi:uncharacterized iron-regulated membrane protein
VRRILFWFHLCAGVTAGVVGLVMSATGVLLAYEKQLTAWAESCYRSRSPADDAAGLGLEAVLARVRETNPDVATGIVLWWPRELARPALAAITLFRTEVHGRARDFNWHNVAGFWSALPLFLIVLCAVFMSYPWATDLLYRVTGSPPPSPRPAPADQGRARREPPSLQGADYRFARAKKMVPDWRSITVHLPASSDDDPTVTIDAGNGGRPDLRGQLVFPRESPDVVSWERFESQSPGRRLRTWARFLHTGEAGGLVGLTVAAVAATGAILIVCTGLSMALRRFASWRARAGARRPPVATS